MPRFLHVADVHLGFDRYDSAERTKDFFLAFKDALEHYALGAEVDFVLIAGDLFEHRHILPATLNQAQVCLDMLQEAAIPVLAIEGNHDHRPYGTKTSWLRYLADWGLLILLEPSEEQEAESGYFKPWTPETRTGSYIDLDCGVRVLGSRWYGAAAPRAIQELAVAIQQLPPGPPQTVMLFHHGLEGQISRYAGALRYSDLLPLKEAGVDYLALGHIHKHYTVENWIFNPGSVEANSIAEGQQQNPRGVYLVEIDQGEIRAELKREYYQRPIVRLSLEDEPWRSQEELVQAAIAHVEAVASAGKTAGAIVELRLQGAVNFNRLDLDVRSLQNQLHQMSQALIFRLKYDVTGTEYRTYIGEIGEQGPSRAEVEQQVFMDYLSANAQYREQAEPLARGLGELKQQVLKDQPETVLYSFVERLLREQESQPDSEQDGSDTRKL